MLSNSMWDQFLTDTVRIVKENGDTFEDVKAQISKEGISIHDIQLPLEEGDLILRTLPNNLTERYTIVDTGFQQAFHSIPAMFNCKVRKQTSIPTKDVPQMITQHFHGSVGNIATGSSHVQQTAHINPVGQQLNVNYDPIELRNEIAQLLTILRQQASEPEEYAALGELASAEKAIAAEDKQKMIQHLVSAGQKAGKWIFDGASSVGFALLTEVLKPLLIR